MALLARGTARKVRLTGNGELIIPPLTAEDVPGRADALRTERARDAAPRAPRVGAGRSRRRTGFADHLAHARGKVTSPQPSSSATAR